MTSVKKAGGLAADAFGSLAFEFVGFFLAFFAGTMSTSCGLMLSPKDAGMDSARAFRVRLFVTGMAVVVCCLMLKGDRVNVLFLYFGKYQVIDDATCAGDRAVGRSSDLARSAHTKLWK